MNIDVEVTQAVSELDDALEAATEEFLVGFAERHMSDWMSTHGATEKAVESFSELESEILRKALVVIRTRWERSGN